jgi:hypothetical protein
VMTGTQSTEMVVPAPASLNPVALAKALPHGVTAAGTERQSYLGKHVTMGTSFQGMVVALDAL